MTKLKPQLNALLAELEDIAQWFEQTPNADIDEALKRADRGVALVVTIKEQLKARENKFQEVSKKLEK